MKVYVLSALVMFTSLLFGQNMWEEPLLLREPGDLEWEQASVTTGNNEIVHVWAEYQLGVKSIFAMKYDSAGNQLWGDEAIIINDSSGYQEYPDIISSNDGGFIITWERVYPYPSTLRAQKLNSNGEKLWGENGVSFAEEDDNLYAPNIDLFPNDLGGAIAVWMDAGRAFAVSLDSEGTDQWCNLISQLQLTESGYDFEITSDGMGGLIVAKEISEGNLSCSRIDASGELAWQQAQILEFNDYNDTLVKILYNNVDGYYFFSYHNDGEVGGTLIRKISLDGELDSFETFIPLPTYSLNISLSVGCSVNDNGDLFVVQRAIDGINLPIYVLLGYRLDQQLNHIWDSNGVVIGSSEFDTPIDPIECNNLGELFFLTYYNDDIEDRLHFSLSKTNSQGILESEENGFLISQNIDLTSQPYLRYDEDLFIAWREHENGNYSLKQQILNTDMEVLLSEESEIVRLVESGEVFIDPNLEISAYPLINSESSIIIWLDKRDNAPDRIMYQIVHSDGSVEFPGNGLAVTESEIGLIRNYATAQNDQKQICLVWSEESSNLVYSRIIDSDGSILASNNEPIYGDSDDSFASVQDISLSSKDNKFYLGFIELNYFNQLHAYFLSTDNNSDWFSPILIDSDLISVTNQFLSIQIINNYCIIDTQENNCSVYRMSELGEVTLVQENIHAGHPSFKCDSENNLFYHWHNSQLQICVQGIRNTNELYWDNSVVVSYHPQYQEPNYAIFGDFIVSDAVYVIWYQSNSPHSHNEVRVQKISFEGNRMWDVEGVLLTNTCSFDTYINIEQLNDDYMTPFWGEYGNSNYIVHKVNVLGNDGILHFGDDGLDLTADTNSIFNFKGVQLNHGKIMYVWDSLNSLYAQMFDFSAVDNENNDATPISMSIGQNYPNPFNPETNISFDINRSGLVKLEIYNLKGQKVKTLVNDKFEVGRHSVVWNGRDDSDKEVASGIYFYRIKNGEKSLTRKMILMK